MTMSKRRKKKLQRGALTCAVVVCAAVLLWKLLMPASVGTLGGVKITDGIYKLAQFSAFQTAYAAANDDQAALTVRQFVNGQMAVDENGDPDADANAALAEGEQTELEMMPVKEIIARQTEHILRDFAAVEKRFAELGGTLTAEQIAEADEYAVQLWESYGTVYYANGINLKDIKEYEYNYYKSQQLLSLTYGENGETPVGSDALTAYLQEDSVYGYYVMIPLYNTSSYVFADETQTAGMLEKAQAIVDSYNEASAAGPAQPTGEAALAAFTDALTDGIAEVYAVLEMEYDPAEGLETDLTDGLFLREELVSYFGEETAAVLEELEPGQAAAVQYSSFGLMVFLRADPLDGQELADWEPTLLNALKGTELSEALETSAEELENKLNSFAMGRYSAKNIVLG